MANNTIKGRQKHAVIGQGNTGTSSVPLKGEIIFNSDLDNLRVGDGSKSYSQSDDLIPEPMTAADINTIIAANGHKYVDLGVVVNNKKILFATMNVGANSITDYGNYYAWGETTTKNDYGWNTYRFNPSGDGTTFTKYNSTDQKVTLDLEDDPVCVNMGGQWRSPTDAELQALLDQTTSAWVTDYNGSGINGRVFTGTNGNTMFVPATGYRGGTSFKGAGSYASWWSSSLDGVGSVLSRRLYFSASGCYVNINRRCDGLSARGVIAVDAQ